MPAPRSSATIRARRRHRGWGSSARGSRSSSGRIASEVEDRIGIEIDERKIGTGPPDQSITAAKQAPRPAPNTQQIGDSGAQQQVFSSDATAERASTADRST
eukprot:15436713-Alexandrium_andersonii.AAC.1